MKTIYTKEIEQCIIDNFDKSVVESRKILLDKFGLDVSGSALSHKRQRLGYNHHEPLRRHNYTSEEDDFLREHSLGTNYVDLTKMFNYKFKTSVSRHSIEHRCFRLGCRNGVDCKFKKGDREIHNWTPIGTIRTTKHKGCPWGEHLQWIKVKDDINSTTNWMPLHKYLWEQENGKVPKGYFLTLKDRDYRNCSLDNIMLVNKKELTKVAKVNGWTTDGNINEAMILTTRLENLCERKNENGKSV